MSGRWIDEGPSAGGEAGGDTVGAPLAALGAEAARMSLDRADCHADQAK